ncbi:MAG: Sec-independent protein translocase protein TatB [Rhizobiaceae bacterium]|nr:Sec-independent protein translocase protein TatB [Rhizobiaceae bacterium]
MLEVGWSEILVIAIVLIVIVGPKDLPKMLRTFGTTMRKMRAMAGDFQHQFNEALKEAELDEVRKTIDDVRGLNPRNAIRDALDPLRQVGEDVRRELNKSDADIRAKAAALDAQPKAETAPVPAPVAPIAVPPATVALAPGMPKGLIPETPDVSGPATRPRTAAKAKTADKTAAKTADKTAAKPRVRGRGRGRKAVQKPAPTERRRHERGKAGQRG